MSSSASSHKPSSRIHSDPHLGSTLGGALSAPARSSPDVGRLPFSSTWSNRMNVFCSFFFNNAHVVCLLCTVTLTLTFKDKTFDCTPVRIEINGDRSQLEPKLATCLDRYAMLMINTLHKIQRLPNNLAIQQQG